MIQITSLYDLSRSLIKKNKRKQKSMFNLYFAQIVKSERVQRVLIASLTHILHTINYYLINQEMNLKVVFNYYLHQ